MKTKFLPSSHFLKGTFAFTFASFVAAIAGYFLNLAVARGLSVESYGEYASAFAYVSLVTAPLSGFQLWLVKEIARQEGLQRLAVTKHLEIVLIQELVKKSFFILGLALIAATLLWFQADLTPISIAFIFILSAASFFVTFYNSVFQAFRSFVKAGSYNLFLALLKVGFGVMAVVIVPNLTWVFLAIILAHLITGLVGYFFSPHRHLVSDLKLEAHLQPFLSKKNMLTLLFSTLALTALINVDVVMVKIFFDDYESGLYGALSLLTRIILYLGLPIVTVTYSFLASKSNRQDTIRMIMVSGAGLILIGILTTSAYALLPQLIIWLIFGSKYVSIAPLIWLSGVYGSLFTLVYLFTHLLLLKNSKWSLITILAVVAQISSIVLFHSSLFLVMMVSCLCLGVSAVVLWAAFVTRSE